jgi:hypothetical protein
MLSVSRILIDGTVLCLVIGVMIMGSLYINPRLWLQDYPAEIRAKVPPLSAREKRMRYMVAVPFLLLLLGGPVYSTLLLRAEYGGALPFGIAYLHVFLLLQLFNLFDAVVLDLLILALMQPKFATIPGAEGMEYLYRDWGMHLKNYLKGIVICSVLSLPLALAGVV